MGGALRLKRGVAEGLALWTVEASDRPPVRDKGI